MEEIARVYAEALFESAKEKDRLDEIRDQLGEFADALDSNRELATFFFSPYFSSAEKREAIRSAVSGAESELVNFLELLAEKHRMPAIFRIRRELDRLWAQENRQLDVTLTSAVELDPAIAKQVGDEVSKQTDQKVELTSHVDPDILGGLVLQVGNMVLDTSIRSRLERLRREIARAA
jgi:F-type H+-transporting ATPase subunit delta